MGYLIHTKKYIYQDNNSALNLVFFLILECSCYEAKMSYVQWFCLQHWYSLRQPVRSRIKRRKKRGIHRM